MKWAVVFPAVVLAVASCDEPNVHILTGQLYDPAAACVGVSNGVDVLPGAAVDDNCSPSCLTTTSGDSSAIYVTTECPPFPGYTVEAEDATTGAGDPCTGAFAAYAAFDDSGVTCPVTEGDGGEEAGDDGAAPGEAGAGDAGPGDAGAGDAGDAGAE